MQDVSDKQANGSRRVNLTVANWVAVATLTLAVVGSLWRFTNQINQRLSFLEARVEMLIQRDNLRLEIESRRDPELRRLMKDELSDRESQQGHSDE